MWILAGTAAAKWTAMQMTGRLVPLALVLLGSATAFADHPVGVLISGTRASTPATVAGKVTLSGKIFFNDRRDDGLFSTRRDRNGVPGTECGTDGVRPDGTSCAANWMGAHYMVVDVIERDTGYFAPTAWDCKQEDILASVMVGVDGTFTASFTPTDPCDSDRWTSPAIALRVRTRYCGSTCFSVNEDPDSPYVLFHPDASWDAPLMVSAGRAFTVGNMGFNPAGTSTTVANDTSIAANYYASLVDTVLTVHSSGGIPFFKDEFGEIQYVYPASGTGNATTLSASEVIIAPKTDWVRGEVVAHEYGHVTMLRAWDGDYGWDGIGLRWSANEKLEKRLAFKEGFANFMSRAVFTETMPCDAAHFDDNATTPLPGDLGEGAHWVTNVNKLLCDWYDRRNDDDPTLTGGGDHFAAEDLYSMWFNLRNMYLQRDAYGGDYEAGLTICDWVDYYLEVRKGVAAVGSATHDAYVTSITDLAYNENIACFLPAP